MQLVTNEMTGMFLLPLANGIGNMVWSILNGIGIIFVPFVFLIVRCFFEARAQGLDEGSPAAYAIKLFEKSFWGYVVVIIFVLLPTRGELTVEHRQFSCADNPSLISNDYSSRQNSTANQRVLDVLGARDVSSPSLWVGFMHQLSVGFTETAVSKLSCQRGLTANEVTTSLKNQIPQTESVYRSILSFDEQCYNIAQTNIHKAMAEGEVLRSSTSNSQGWHFWPPSYAVDNDLMRQAYQGFLLYDRNMSPINMTVPNHWFNNDVKGQTLSCDELAESLYRKIERDMESSDTYAQDMNRLLSFSQLTNPSASEPVIKHDMILSVYMSALNERGSKESEWTEKKESSFSARSLQTGLRNMLAYTEVGQALNFTENAYEHATDKSSSTLDIVSKHIVELGGVVTSMVETPKSHASVMMMPIIITLMQTILLVALPLVVVISGYSFKVIFNWTVFYFSVTMAQFWLALGGQVETLLLALLNRGGSVMDSITALVSQSDSYLVTSIAATFVYMTPVIWIMIVQILANISATSMMNAVASSAVVGQVGAESLFRSTNKAVSRTINEFKDEKNKNSSTTSATNTGKSVSGQYGSSSSSSGKASSKSTI